MTNHLFSGNKIIYLFNISNYGNFDLGKLIIVESDVELYIISSRKTKTRKIDQENKNDKNKSLGKLVETEFAVLYWNIHRENKCVLICLLNLTCSKML